MNSDSQDLSAAAKLAAVYADLEAQAQAHTMPLATTAQDIVPGEGSATADVLFIGEAPGEQEAKQRRPFVGRSGQLLRKHIVQVGLEQQQYYIANVVKVRPPANRDPSLDEIEAYRPFLEKEVEIIAPKLIATLGRFSMAAFLPDVKISQVHGRLHKVKYNGVKYFVLPLYHPAAALRNGNMLASFEADFQKIPKILEWIRQQEVKEFDKNAPDKNAQEKSSTRKTEKNGEIQNLESEILATLLQ